MTHSSIRVEVTLQNEFERSSDANSHDVLGAVFRLTEEMNRDEMNVDGAVDALSSSELDTPVTISQATWESWFQQWLTDLKPDLSPINAYELTLRLTTDAEIRVLNRQYRHYDQPTDVLAFAALETEDMLPEDIQYSQPLYLGDLVISVDTAWMQAKNQGHTLSEELVWLATHGLLHLLGWDHPDDESLDRMLKQQSKMLKAIARFNIQR